MLKLLYCQWKVPGIPELRLCDYLVGLSWNNLIMSIDRQSADIHFLFDMLDHVGSETRTNHLGEGLLYSTLTMIRISSSWNTQINQTDMKEIEMGTRRDWSTVLIRTVAAWLEILTKDGWLQGLLLAMNVTHDLYLERAEHNTWRKWYQIYLCKVLPLIVISSVTLM